MAADCYGGACAVMPWCAIIARFPKRRSMNLDDGEAAVENGVLAKAARKAARDISQSARNGLVVCSWEQTAESGAKLLSLNPNLDRWLAEPFLPFDVEAQPVNHRLHIKMAQHLDSRCVLLSDPSTKGAGGKTCLESSILEI